MAHFAAGGILWTLGERVSEQLNRLKHNVVAEHVAVSVYETSNCSERDPACGPGYASSPGIQLQLCFHLDFSNELPGSSYEDNFCIHQYDALAFAGAQPGLIRTLP